MANACAVWQGLNKTASYEQGSVFSVFIFFIIGGCVFRGFLLVGNTVKFGACLFFTAVFIAALKREFAYLSVFFLVTFANSVFIGLL